MDQRVSLITLGVEDVGRAQRFYEALGRKLDGGVDDETDHVAFFQTPAMIVALWDRGKLAADSCVEDDGGWRAMPEHSRVVGSWACFAGHSISVERRSSQPNHPIQVPREPSRRERTIAWQPFW